MAEEEPPESFHLESFEDAFRKVKAQVKVDLATCAVMLQRLLMAVDLFPLGGLYRGHYAEQAIRRYWLLWLPLLHGRQSSGDDVGALLPPIDVQWAWFVHRLNPEKYVRDCTARFGSVVHAAHIDQALGFSSGYSRHSAQRQQQQDKAATDAPVGELTRQVWEAAYPAGPGQPPEHVFWPPAPAPPSTSSAQRPQPHPLEQQRQPCRLPHKCQHPDKCQHHPHPQPKESCPSGDAGVRSSSSSGGCGGGGDATAPSAGCTASPAAAAAAAGNGDSSRSAGGKAARADPAGAPPGAAAADGGGGSGDGGSGGGDSGQEAGGLESVRGYVADAMVRQGRFLHQMLRYFYQDLDFLEAGRVRYLRFLALIRTQPPGASILNPMYDQDVLWHSHLATSFAYVPDCEAVMPEGKRPLGHDDTLSAESLVDSFLFTLGRYEKVTGLMVNPSPTRRLPTFIAQPLVAQLWPLAAALADPRVAHQQLLPPPRKLAAELRAGGMQQLQQYQDQHQQQQQQHQQEQEHKKKQKEWRQQLGAADPSPSPSRSGIFCGDPDNVIPGRTRPPMLGSPDHLCRAGAFAVYALWCLAERLQLGPEDADQAPGTATAAAAAAGEKRRGAGGPRVSGGSGGGGSGVRGGLRLFGGCFSGGSRSGEAEAARGGRGLLRVGKAELDEAIGYMTRQLLHLSDLTDPTSPFSSHLHPFWEDVTPLPPPQLSPGAAQQQQQPSQTASSEPSLPASTSSSTSDPHAAAASAARDCNAKDCGADVDGGGGKSRRRRHPDPAPPIDLPASYLPVEQRSAEPAYLAPHQYSVRGQVYYTPSDFCLLGRGRWCLPGPLAAEIAEREATAAEASVGLVYDDGADVDTAQDDRIGGGGGRRRRGRGLGRWWGRDDPDGGEANDVDRGPRLYGNTLGGIVFSEQWPARMADCYRRIYEELQRRAAASPT